jgi:hypothetical protein
MKKMFAVLAVVAVATVVTVGYAAVTFDPATGTGFVGKGDVQTVYGWNNKGAQDNATLVSFSYVATAVYEQSCLKDNARTTLSNTFTSEVPVNSGVAYDARKQNQYTGWNLTGLAGAGSGGSVESCPAVGNDTGWYADPSDPEPRLVEGSSSGALTVHHASGSHVIWSN